MPGCSVNAIFRVIFRTVDNSGFACPNRYESLRAGSFRKAFFVVYLSHCRKKKLPLNCSQKRLK